MLWRRVGTGLLALAIVLFVAWVVSRLAMDENQVRWARISEFHATWIPETGGVRNSFWLESFADCPEVTVEKAMRPIKNGVVQTDVAPIIFQGQLPEKIQRYRKGAKGTIFDDAIPTTGVPILPGEYWLTMVVGCTRDGVTQRTEPVSAKIDVGVGSNILQ